MTLDKHKKCVRLQFDVDYEYDSHSPMPLTKQVPLLASHLEISALKAVAPVNMPDCDSMRSGATLLLKLGVVAMTLDKHKNGVRLQFDVDYEYDSHSPMPLTNWVPLLTFQVEISALNADALSNMPYCDSMRSGATLLLKLGVVAMILDEHQKNGVRPCLVVLLMNKQNLTCIDAMD